jgi:hypothetical protein
MKFNLRKLKKNKKASISYFMVFIYLMFILLTLFALFIPIGIDLNVAFFGAGDDILADSENRLNEIDDSDVKTGIQNNLDAAQESTGNQIDILSSFFQYGWILIVVIVTFVIFVIARSNIEVGLR